LGKNTIISNAKVRRRHSFKENKHRLIWESFVILANSDLIKIYDHEEKTVPVVSARNEFIKRLCTASDSASNRSGYGTTGPAGR
jgi:hypothetical protein